MERENVMRTQGITNVFAMDKTEVLAVQSTSLSCATVRSQDKHIENRRSAKSELYPELQISA
jgi:hypothetical protein